MPANYPECFETSPSLMKMTATAGNNNEEEKGEKKSREQTGGGSAFNTQFHASIVKGGNHEISRVTAANIDKAPMFNPFSKDAVIPTAPSTGIVPTGIYLLEQQRAKKAKAQGQTGGRSVDEVTKEKLAQHTKKSAFPTATTAVPKPWSFW
jgi:hypothetical protein